MKIKNQMKFEAVFGEELNFSNKKGSVVKQSLIYMASPRGLLRTSMYSAPSGSH
jgi:hypothetical protein